MTTECYSLVGGLGIRATGLTTRGALPDPYTWVASKAIARMEVTEVTDGGSNELLRGENDDPRLLSKQEEEVLRCKVDIDFSGVDVLLLGLITGNPIVLNADGSAVGFDADTKITPVAFALEVWSALAGRCSSVKYGYTLFPHLKGGLMSGFAFANGVVSFTLRGAQTRRGGTWGLGPYGIDTLDPVSGNTMWRNMSSVVPPPPPGTGVGSTDIIEGGDAAYTSPDIIDGQFVVTSSGVVDGGDAA